MDNFDLKKFLKESKAIENLNPSIKAINENKSLRDKIKEMIVAELAEETATDMMDPVYEGDPEYSDYDEIEDEYTDEDTYYGHMQGLEDMPEEDLEEAAKKKDKDVEDVEDVEVTDTTEEVPADEEAPAEEAPVDVAGGLEDISADMKGTEGDLMDHLMKAFKIAKGMNNEKLETQVGNTLKFFVSEYIGGGND
jgi:hypothetical protein